VTLTAKDVAEITRLLAESDFDELFLELDGLKLTLRRNGAAMPPPADAAPAATPAAATASPAVTALPTATPSPAAAAAPSATADPGTRSVTAPLLGTFYRAPKPGAPPFVEIGSAVEEDTIIGIIEVMKLMNTVRAGTRGRVLDILAKDGALVEYGEALMLVSEAAA
jgi:acetyl-CoA carboxylase biotin carboxyl carrier protein